VVIGKFFFFSSFEFHRASYLTCSEFISHLAAIALVPLWSEEHPLAFVPIGEAAAAAAASAAAAAGDYQSLAVLVCNRRVLAATVDEYPPSVPAVSSTILATAAQRYAATGTVSAMLLVT
jgi:hypothetical protein